MRQANACSRCCAKSLLMTSPQNFHRILFRSEFNGMKNAIFCLRRQLPESIINISRFPEEFRGTQIHIMAFQLPINDHPNQCPKSQPLGQCGCPTSAGTAKAPGHLQLKTVTILWAINHLWIWSERTSTPCLALFLKPIRSASVPRRGTGKMKSG